MIAISSVKVTNWVIERMSISWTIGNTTEDIAEYGFDVYRSEAEHGPFVRLTPRSLVDRFVFYDNHPPTQNFNRRLWYIVRVTHRASGEYTEYPPTTKHGTISNLARTIQRNSYQLYRAYIGRWLHLYPARTFGPKCPSCTDDVSGITSFADCRLCYGTTYTGGFHYPVRFLGQIDGTERSEQLSDQNQAQVLMFNLRTPTATPELRPGDLVVDHLNERYRITKTSDTAQLRHPIHYEAAMVWVPHSDILYQVPLRPIEDDTDIEGLPDGVRADLHNSDGSDRIDGGTLPELLLSFAE